MEDGICSRVWQMVVVGLLKDGESDKGILSI